MSLSRVLVAIRPMAATSARRFARAGTMEIIDLSSDGEAIVDLCSDGEDSSSTNMCSDSEDDHGHHDFRNPFRQQPLHSLSTTSDDTSSDDEPVMLDGDGFLSTHQATSYYRTSKDLPRQPMPSVTSVIDFEADSSQNSLKRVILLSMRKPCMKKPCSISVRKKGKKICLKVFCQFRSLSISISLDGLQGE
ncbi:hypothetical protein PAHAL_7G301400 [Panicum hallii]|uniref:Uncharacterized protein n=1 Tax=Panicum hallii TaxID=206008 RepID=A0A2T8IE09_9POAL|nr:hypothetical protein PAHAL_7G301400 [Panicum hallii]